MIQFIQGILLVFMAALVLGIPVLKADQEAKSYNRMCGGTATTWDALFTELRVDGNCHQSQKAGE